MSAERASTLLHWHQLSGIVHSAERLATGTRSWATFAPKADALDEAIAAADGLARALRELRTTLHRTAVNHIMLAHAARRLLKAAKAPA